MLRKIVLAAAMLSTVFLAGCIEGEVTCTGTVKTSTKLTTPLENPLLNSMILDANTKARNQGYDPVTYLARGASYSDIMWALGAGETSANGFATYSVTNARLANAAGNVLVQLIRDDAIVASNTFAYRVSGSELVLESPAALDAWLETYRKAGIELVDVSVPDLAVDSGTESKTVSFAMAMEYNGSTYGSSSSSWYSKKEETTCARCQTK